MRRFCLFLVLLLSTYASLAQTIISGVVKDKANAEPLPNVHVLVKNVETETIMAFGITKDDGTFKVTVKNAVETILLEVNKLGFHKEILIIENKTQTINLNLEQGEVELKELIVKPPPVRRTGDTLDYNIAAFKTESDRSIGDVISRLPGIEVDPRGEILYQGEPINKYYVEDMDLLGRRYGLVNDNLPHGKVATVQIYENHQPIRSLDSTEISTRAALNIKLTNKYTYTGVLNYGVGYKPVLWEVNATPIVFTPNFQFLGSLQSNNTGEDIMPRFFNFLFGEVYNKENWLSVNTLFQPSFSAKRWLDNQSHAGSLNVLKRKKSDTEFKLNSNIIFDRQKREGASSTTYFIGDEEVRYSEDIHSLFRTNQATVNLETKKNTSKTYFTNKFEFEKEWISHNGINKRVDKSYDQLLKTGNLSLSNTFHRVIKRNAQTYNFYSLLLYGENNQNLNVDYSATDSSANPLQNFNHQVFLTNNYLKFNRRIRPKLALTMEPGFRVQQSTIKSDLINYSSDHQLNNDFNWLSFKPYISPGINVTPKNWNIHFRLPVSYYLINYKPEENILNYSKLAPEPSMNFTYSKKANTSFSGMLRHTKHLSRLGDQYNGLIMSNYLTFNYKDSEFRNTSVYLANLSFKHNNAVSGLNLNGSVGFNQQIQNFQEETNIFEDGSKEIIVGKTNHTAQRYFSNFKISKYWFDLKTSTNFGLNLSQFNSQRILNGLSQGFRVASIRPDFSITFNGIRRMSATYKLTYNYRNSGGVVSVYELKQDLNTSVFLAKNLSGLITLEHYNIRSNQSDNYFFGDITMRYTIPKTTYDFEIGWTNIFNQKEFKTIQISDYYHSETLFHLRPPQLIIRGKMSF